MESRVSRVERVRRQLGAVGVYATALRAAPMEEVPMAVARMESLGFGSIWTGEQIGGKEAFVQTAVTLGATSRIVVGTGIANMWCRPPEVMEGGAATLAATWPGRFVLGVGISHSGAVEASGQKYRSSVAHVMQYLEEMAKAERLGPRPSVPFARVLGALGPRMLEVAREYCDGAHPYCVPPDYVPIAREILGKERLLIPEQAVVVTKDAVTARAAARDHLEFYLGLPNYVKNLQRLGYGDRDLQAGGSDRLVDALVVWGSEEVVIERVKELREAGADHVLLQPIGRDRSLGGVVGELEKLAPALAQLDEGGSEVWFR